MGNGSSTPKHTPNHSPRKTSVSSTPNTPRISTPPDYSLLMAQWLKYVKNDTAKALALLNQYPDFAFVVREDGVTALHDAAFYGKLELVDKLISQGANLVAEAEIGNATPLEYAVVKLKVAGTDHDTYIDVIKHLLKKGSPIQDHDQVEGELHQRPGHHKLPPLEGKGSVLYQKHVTPFEFKGKTINFSEETVFNVTSAHPILQTDNKHRKDQKPSSIPHSPKTSSSHTHTTNSQCSSPIHTPKLKDRISGKNDETFTEHETRRRGKSTGNITPVSSSSENSYESHWAKKDISTSSTRSRSHRAQSSSGNHSYRQGH
ncbi:MAG: ankyrin repeat domain protein [Rickettsiales bacterium]|jgi:hypothetical protein|nr:ankyrin repeat domain protein [Rickettsiales bacterium]